MARDPKSDVLQLNLSRYHSLDVVRLPKSRKYRVVFAERFGVQRRAFVEISFDEAHRLALFLASVDDKMHGAEVQEELTDPSRPSKMPPEEIREIERSDFDRETLPLPPLPEIPRPRRPSSESAVPRALEDDPRTGVVPVEYQDTVVKPEDDD